MTTNRGYSLREASGVGVGVGVGALVLYLVAGLFIARWSLAAFFAHLTPGTVLGLLLAVCLVIACFALPIAAYLYDGLRSPLVVLFFVLVGWFGYGVASSLLTVQTVFGLAIYATYLSPLYLVLYAVTGSIEYYLLR